MEDESVRRIDRLEERVGQLESEVALLRAVPAAPYPTVFPGPIPPPPTLSQPTLSQPVGEATLHHPRSFELDGETALKWAGVGLVVLAVSFLVSTAINRGWLGPELQLVGAVAVSGAMTSAGFRLRLGRRPWAHALCTGGVLALFATVASSLFLDQFDHRIAFLLTASTGVGGYALARRIPSQWVATSTLLGSMVGWVVIADGDGPFDATLAWVTVAVAAAIGLGLERRWFALRLAAQLVGAIGGLVLAFSADPTRQQVELLVVAAIFFVSIAWTPSRGHGDSGWREVEIQLVVLAPTWAFLVIVAALDLGGERVPGSVAIAVAVASGTLGLTIRRWIRRSHLVSMLVGASITLSIGSALLLSSTAAFLAFAVQAAGLVVLSRKLDRRARVLLNAAAVALISGSYVAGATIQGWRDDLLFGDDIVHLAIIASLGVAAWQTRERLIQQLGFASVLVGLLVWLGSVLVHLPQGQALVSLSWAVVGTASLVGGAVRKERLVGASGLAVLAVTVGKLLTVDLREVDALWRAALFFAVGVGIMRVGFLLPRLTDTDERRGEDPTP